MAILDKQVHDEVKDKMYNRITDCLDQGLNEPSPKKAAIWFGRAEEECNRAKEWLLRLAATAGEEGA